MSFFPDFFELLFGTNGAWRAEVTESGIFRLGAQGDTTAAVASINTAQKEGNNETENGKTSETAKYAACNRAR